jgi:psp operon transcriptional activator
MPTEPERLLGESPAFLRILEEVSQVAPLEKPVLIVGERGTGKELIAARLHFLSNRWEGEYLKMNCAAISDSLLETELFGHEAGAFTGATKAHKGRFERAHGGTLFLDELATTSTLVQEKLLRVIEYGEYERVGGNRTLHCDVRLIAATNEDLPALADRGKFRHDLLDRLAFDVLTLPPLREREDDILLLAEHFAVSMAQELGRELFPGFSREAQAKLQQYPWPGNVRELKNVVERCVYRHDEDTPVEEIVFDPFKSPFRLSTQSSPAATKTGAPSSPSDDGTDGPQSTAADTAPAAAIAAEFPIDLKQTVQRYEIELIEQALVEAKHNQRKAAELLEVTYHQLRGYLKKYDLLNKE